MHKLTPVEKLEIFIILIMIVLSFFACLICLPNINEWLMMFKCRLFDRREETFDTKSHKLARTTMVQKVLHDHMRKVQPSENFSESVISDDDLCSTDKSDQRTTFRVNELPARRKPENKEQTIQRLKMPMRRYRAAQKKIEKQVEMS